MLEDAALEGLLHRLGLKPPGLAYVRRVRTTPPSRRVRGGRRSLAGRFPSRKMGRTIQFESLSAEMVLAVRFENDPTIYEYWDQPEPIKITYTDNEGHKRGFWYTPDFLSIGEFEIALWQAKLESELFTLREEKPRFYVLTPDGTWQMPRADESCKVLGFPHKVFSSTQANNNLVNNLTLLSGFVDDDDDHDA